MPEINILNFLTKNVSLNNNIINLFKLDVNKGDTPSIIAAKNNNKTLLIELTS